MKKIAGYIEKYTGLKPPPYEEIMNNKALYSQCYSYMLEPLMLSFEEEDFKKILLDEDVQKEIKNRGYTHFVEDYRYLQKVKKFMTKCDESQSPYNDGLFATEYMKTIPLIGEEQDKTTALYISGHCLRLRLVNISHKDDNYGPINESGDFVQLI